MGMVDSELEIVKLLTGDQETDLPPDVARFFLGIQLRPADRARMEELGTKANRGTLAPGEERELDEYIRLCDSLAILHAKAQLSLKPQSPAA